MTTAQDFETTGFHYVVYPRDLPKGKPNIKEIDGKIYYTVPPIPPAQVKLKSMKHLLTYGSIY